MSNITALQFQSHILKPIQYNNQFWLTSSDIAIALQYKSEDSVTKIFNRNSDEFSVDMTETVKLTASGNYQNTIRVFSLRGAHLIAMFSRTAIAKDFRKWVLDILDEQTNKAVKPTNLLTHPADIKFINPLDEITMTFNRQEITQLNALFGSFEYLDANFWPHMQALFPNLNNEYTSVFETARMMLKIMKNRREECKELSELILGK